MNITMTPDVFLRLSMVESVVGKREYSGYGFVTIEKNGDETYFRVYDVVLLDVGSTGWTEFNSRAILDVLNREDAANMKIWFHRHPVGNGKPGPQNWSGTDENTCLNEPLGCPDPDKVKWALAMVLTPGGWVGRLDQFKDGKHKTTHLPVKVEINSDIVQKAKELLEAQVKQEKATVALQIPELEAPPEYIDILEGHAKESDFETAHAEVDEAFSILDVAKFQIKSKDYKEALDSLYWCYGIAEIYKSNPYVAYKTADLMDKVDRLVRKIPRKVRNAQ